MEIAPIASDTRRGRSYYVQALLISPTDWIRESRCARSWLRQGPFGFVLATSSTRGWSRSEVRFRRRLVGGTAVGIVSLDNLDATSAGHPTPRTEQPDAGAADDLESCLVAVRRCAIRAMQLRYVCTHVHGYEPADDAAPEDPLGGESDGGDCDPDPSSSPSDWPNTGDVPSRMTSATTSPAFVARFTICQPPSGQSGTNIIRYRRMTLYPE